MDELFAALGTIASPSSSVRDTVSDSETASVEESICDAISTILPVVLRKVRPDPLLLCRTVSTRVVFSQPRSRIRLFQLLSSILTDFYRSLQHESRRSDSIETERARSDATSERSFSNSNLFAGPILVFSLDHLRFVESDSRARYIESLHTFLSTSYQSMEQLSIISALLECSTYTFIRFAKLALNMEFDDESDSSVLIARAFDLVSPPMNLVKESSSDINKLEAIPRIILHVIAFIERHLEMMIESVEGLQATKLHRTPSTPSTRQVRVVLQSLTSKWNSCFRFWI